MRFLLALAGIMAVAGQASAQCQGCTQSTGVYQVQPMQQQMYFVPQQQAPQGYMMQQTTYQEGWGQQGYQGAGVSVRAGGVRVGIFGRGGNRCGPIRRLRGKC